MPASTLPGLLLLSDDAKRVDLWVQRGVVPSYVVQLSGWSGVVPTGPALADPPYDDALTVLANAPVPMTMRNALGFFQIGDRAVMVVHSRKWRALPRWLVWEPDRGLARVNLPQGRPADLVRAAGVVDKATKSVESILADRGSTPLDLLSDVIEALGLPGGSLVRGNGVGDGDDAMLIEPNRRAVNRFGRALRTERDTGWGAS
ncbi:hypothetical protein [Leekyejoonella antrihumi]|uniref:Uncharacterized protein n=1 Tax=Leekyejoonella antrihumi TaxID=1660198 RepID=A0A563DSH2_9MICO|nr:hypothetical protein [Leekyejoonella antrihumi]TWP32933.1 hypothetical protein FGL98_22865 [Leekyejoonella antrihumi]